MIALALFVALSIACTVLALTRHPIFGLYFYLATIYVHPPSRWWGQTLPDLRWALLAAAITGVGVILHKRREVERPLWLANPPAFILSSYATWMWIQCLWAADLTTHLEGCVQYVKYLLAFWLIVCAVDSKEHLRNFLFAHAIGCGLLGVYARMTERIGDRLDGVGGPGIDDANTLGMYLATGAIVCGGIILAQNGWRRYLAFVVMALILNGFVLANSRGALLGLVSGALLFALLKARAHRRVFWTLAILAIPASAVVVDQAFVDRMFSIRSAIEQSVEMDGSARSRVELKKAQVQMFLDYPMGAGFRGTATLSPRYLDRQWLAVDHSGDSQDARSSHNTFLSTLVEQGLPGAIMFLVLLVWLGMTSLRVGGWDKRKVDPELTTLAAALCGALVVVYVAGIATDYLMAEVQFWLFASLVVAIRLALVQVPVSLETGPRCRLAR